jgi:hypothetical protein
MRWKDLPATNEAPIMTRLSSRNAGEFARLFNAQVPGAYRRIGATDVRVMTDCDLIGESGYYVRQDLETVRRILRYEHRRGVRPTSQRQTEKTLRCRICRRPLPPNPVGKVGRRREYCPACESSRVRERGRAWRKAGRPRRAARTNPGDRTS